MNNFIKHTLRQHPDEKIQGHTNTREQYFFIMTKGYMFKYLIFSKNKYESIKE